MRYNQIERLGVVETDLVVTKELGWIFREQPIVDVGIDGLIEQSENGNPTGKFLAVQIKTGQSNFHISSDRITYYVSNIHYHYWLNMDLPIILIAHFPETEKTYWQQINKNNLKRIRKRWKLEFSSNQLFNKSAKIKLTQILYNKTNNHVILELFKGRINEESIYDIIQDTDCLGDSAEVIVKIGDIITEFKEKTEAFNSKLRSYVDNGLSDKSSQVIAGIKGFAKDLNIVSRRLEREIDIYAELYSQGLLAFEKISIISFQLSKNSEDFEYAFKMLNNIPNAIEYSLEGIGNMRTGIAYLPKKFVVLKEAKFLLLEVVDMIIYEFTESKSITEEIVTRLGKIQ